MRHGCLTPHPGSYGISPKVTASWGRHQWPMWSIGLNC
jgi:hypothetical protein